MKVPDSNRDDQAALPAPRVTVILPVYNEEACIEGVISELFDCIEGMRGWDVEVIAVDDGSVDGTGTVLESLHRRLPDLRVIRLPHHAGQSLAFVAGFRAATGEILVTMDADGQNDPADIPRLLLRVGDVDCCCGYRRHRRDAVTKRAGSRLANFVRNAVLGEDIIDSGCSLKAFKAGLVADLPAWDGMHRFLPSLFAMQGASIAQIDVHHRPRAAGSSKYSNLGRLPRTIRDLMAVRTMKQRMIRPPARDGAAEPPRSR